MEDGANNCTNEGKSVPTTARPGQLWTPCSVPDASDWFLMSLKHLNIVHVRLPVFDIT